VKASRLGLRAVARDVVHHAQDEKDDMEGVKSAITNAAALCLLLLARRDAVSRAKSERDAWNQRHKGASK
jgi:hypothetical protein